MAFGARILADSIGPNNIPRLTTFEVTFPRPFLAEFNTHRQFSRNSASSRAIPVEKMIERVMSDPYIPMSWGKNQKGMQAGEEVDIKDQAVSRQTWLEARDQAVLHAQALSGLGIHKQLTNRLLEPFLFHTCIVTATEFWNFFHLRNNPMAQPEMQTIAAMMQDLYENSEPVLLNYDEWHLPLLDTAEVFDLDVGDSALAIEGIPTAVKVSVGRCARVSYLTHDGKRDLQADIDLCDSLIKNGHLSPAEHVARPATEDDDVFMLCKANEYMKAGPPQRWSGNLRGWVSYRKTIPGESDIIAYQQQQEK